MKKLLALALAVVMMMAIALPVFAADYSATENGSTETRYGDGNDDSAQTNYTLDAEDSYANDVEIKYGVAQAYTVTIPEAFELHQWTADSETKGREKGYVYGQQNVSVKDVVIAKGEWLNIYLSSKNTTDGAAVWQLKDNLLDEGGNRGTNEASRSDKVDYQVKSFEAEVVNQTWLNASKTIGGIADGGAILNCKNAVGNQGTTGSEAATTLFFSSKGTAQEGTYVDTLTFTVKIENAQAKILNTPAASTEPAVPTDPSVQG